MTIQICKYNKVILFDSEDWLKISPFTWCISGSGYVHSTRTAIGRNILMHRLIMDVVDSPKISIDHINRNKLDNRRSNLRKATHSQNCTNVAPRGKRSKYKGVYVRAFNTKNGPHTYIGAAIVVNKKSIFLGHFNSEIEAARAYDAAVKIHFDEFAYLNAV